MHITIMGPGPQISNTGIFSYSLMYFFKYSKRQSININDVEKVIFHVKRK